DAEQTDSRRRGDPGDRRALPDGAGRVARGDSKPAPGQARVDAGDEPARTPARRGDHGARALGSHRRARRRGAEGGFARPAGAASPSVPWPMLGPMERLDAVIRETRPHRIIAALSERRGKLPVGALLEAQLRGVGVEEGVNVYERLTGKLPIEWLTPSPLIFSPGFRPAPITQALARASSFVASVVGLAFCGPLFGFTALLVRLDSPGRSFFVPDRVGQGGRVFRLIKFRTMRPAGGPRSEWARDNSDRITRVGHWLRKFRLDELPQLINVLRG